MRKAILSISLIVLVLAVFNAFGAEKPGADSQAKKQQVKIDNFSFTPATLTVPVGTEVTWINQDDVPHNIVSSEGKILKSPVLDTDQTFSYTFTQPGTYNYFCGIHPRMVGKVIVQ